MMATSGNYDFSLTAGEIIRDALEHLGVQLPGEAVNADDQAVMLRSLNMMIKAWQAEGIGLWLNQQIAVFPAKSGQSVSLGPTGGNATVKSGVVTSVLSSSVLAGNVLIALESVTGLVIGQYIGVQLSDGTMQWTTIADLPGSDSVTLSAALTGDAGSGGVIFAYTSKIQRPKSIIEMRRVDYSSGTEIPLIAYSRDEYMSLPLKSTVGPPVGWYYDPQTVNGVLYIWPTVDTVQTRLVGTVRTPVQDFTLAQDDADFPPEWYEALSYNVALRGGTKFSVPDETWKRVLFMAGATKTALESFDTEDTSVFMTCAVRY